MLDCMGNHQQTGVALLVCFCVPQLSAKPWWVLRERLTTHMKQKAINLAFFMFGQCFYVRAFCFVRTSPLLGINVKPKRDQ